VPTRDIPAVGCTRIPCTPSGYDREGELLCRFNTDTGVVAVAETRTALQNLDRLTVYVDSKGGREQVDQSRNVCGSLTRLNDALFKPRLHVACAKPMTGRYAYVEAWGVENRWSRLFGAVLCEVMIYE